MPKDSGLFARVEVDEELGTPSWPNGADIDPVSYVEQPTPRGEKGP